MVASCAVISAGSLGVLPVLGSDLQMRSWKRGFAVAVGVRRRTEHLLFRSTASEHTPKHRISHVVPRTRHTPSLSNSLRLSPPTFTCAVCASQKDTKRVSRLLHCRAHASRPRLRTFGCVMHLPILLTRLAIELRDRLASVGIELGAAWLSDRLARVGIELGAAWLGDRLGDRLARVGIELGAARFSRHRRDRRAIDRRAAHDRLRAHCVNIG